MTGDVSGGLAAQTFLPSLAGQIVNAHAIGLSATTVDGFNRASPAKDRFSRLGTYLSRDDGQGRALWTTWKLRQLRVCRVSKVDRGVFAAGGGGRVQRAASAAVTAGCGRGFAPRTAKESEPRAQKDSLAPQRKGIVWRRSVRARSRFCVPIVGRIWSDSNSAAAEEARRDEPWL